MRTYRLGRYQLIGRRELLDAGRPVQIGGRALDLLAVLAEADGRLVTKDELMAALWQGIIVEENALHVHVAAARRALADEADRLVTVYGRGYRLEAQALATDLEAAQGQSVAVLPFTNLTGSVAHDHLGDGLTDTLIARLARFDTIRVASRTSSFSFRDRSVDARQIAAALNVAAVLEGSVRLEVRAKHMLITCPVGVAKL